MTATSQLAKKIVGRATCTQYHQTPPLKGNKLEAGEGAIWQPIDTDKCVGKAIIKPSIKRGIAVPTGN